jgi:hypothetical protein
MKITIMLHGNYSKHFVVHISNINVFVFFHIQGLHISAKPCYTFVGRPAWLELTISHSVNYDVQIYFLYLTFHTALLLLLFIFITFRALDSIMSYGRSKHVIKVNDFDRSNFWEGWDVDISISSKKIKIVLSGNYSKYPVVYIPNINVFVFFHIQGLHICKHHVRFSFVSSRGSGSEFLAHLYLMFVLTECIWRAIMYCDEWSLQFSAFLTTS